MVVFSTGTLLMCNQDAEGNSDAIEIMGGIAFAIDLEVSETSPETLFPGLTHLPSAKKVQGPHAERSTLSNVRCPACDSGQTYVRSGGIDYACRVCNRVWPVGVVDEPAAEVTPISPKLKAKELEAREAQKRELRKRITQEGYRRSVSQASMSEQEFLELINEYDKLVALDKGDEGRAAA